MFLFSQSAHARPLPHQQLTNFWAQIMHKARSYHWECSNEYIYVRSKSKRLKDQRVEFECAILKKARETLLMTSDVTTFTSILFRFLTRFSLLLTAFLRYSRLRLPSALSLLLTFTLAASCFALCWSAAVNPHHPLVRSPWKKKWSANSDVNIMRVSFRVFSGLLRFEN